MSEPVVLIGAGGHAKVIVEILRERDGVHIVGCTAVAPRPEGVLGLPVLGDDTILTELRARGVLNAFVAVGDNRARLNAARRVALAGFQLINAVSSRATVSPSAHLGKGIAIMPGAVVNADVSIADGVIVNTGATVDHDCCIGAYAHIAPGVHLGGGVAVGEGAFLGIAASVIPGVTIGPWATVGAGGVVIRNLPGGIVTAGVPARPLRPAERKDE